MIFVNILLFLITLPFRLIGTIIGGTMRVLGLLISFINTAVGFVFRFIGIALVIFLSIGSLFCIFNFHGAGELPNWWVWALCGIGTGFGMIGLTRNIETLTWELEKAEMELWKEPPDVLLEQIAEVVTSNTPDWSGTATELSEIISANIPINSITKRLNVSAGRLFNEYGIIYRSCRDHDGRRLEFHKVRDGS